MPSNKTRMWIFGRVSLCELFLNKFFPSTDLFTHNKEIYFVYSLYLDRYKHLSRKSCGLNMKI